MHLDEARILVTGGAGFIGSHVTRHLLDRGATVDVVDNEFAGHRDLVPPAATFHHVDLRDDDLVPTVERVDPDGILHLAAIHYIPYCNDNPEDAFDVNVMGTRRLLDAARELEDLETLVYTSSAAVYPPADEPHRETDDEGPMDVYGRTKLAGEDLVELFAAETGVPSVAARLFNVYGPNETNEHLIPAILDQLRDGTCEIKLGNLSPARDFVYVADVARALLALATEFDGDFRAYNVGTGHEYTVEEVVARVSDALGEELHVEQVTDRVRESDRPHLRASTERIEHEIGWTPTVSFVEGLGSLLTAEGLTADGMEPGTGQGDTDT